MREFNNNTVQSVTAVVTCAVLLGGIWYAAVINPIHSTVSKIEETHTTFESKMEARFTGIDATVRGLEINQAQVGVSLQNLAQSIERLAIQLERQADTSRVAGDANG